MQSPGLTFVLPLWLTLWIPDLSSSRVPSAASFQRLWQRHIRQGALGHSRRDLARAFLSCRDATAWSWKPKSHQRQAAVVASRWRQKCQTKARPGWCNEAPARGPTPAGLQDGLSQFIFCSRRLAGLKNSLDAKPLALARTSSAVIEAELSLLASWETRSPGGRND